MLTTIYTLLREPWATANFERYPWGILIVVASVLASTAVIYWTFRGKVTLRDGY